VTTASSAGLSNKTDWHKTARLLLSSFVSLDSIDDRVRILDKLCSRLDGGLYPAFLHILYVIEQSADDYCKKLVSDTFYFAITSGRLPAGKVPAWGAGETIGDSSYGHVRRLGPVEFTCAWYAQPGGLPPLQADSFKTIASSLIRLFSINDNTHSLYCQKIIADSNDTISGTLSANTRQALSDLAHRWASSEEPEKLIGEFIVQTQSVSTLRSITSNPFS
jgi:hypothetical protein